MSSAQNDLAFPTGLLKTCGGPIAMGQVEMATDHGGRPTVRTNGAGSLIDGRPPELRTEDGKRVREGNSAPGKEHRVSNTSGSDLKSAPSVVSD